MKHLMHSLTIVAALVTLFLLAKFMVYHGVDVSTGGTSPEFSVNVGYPWVHSSQFLSSTNVNSYPALIADWAVAVAGAGIIYTFFRYISHQAHKQSPLPPKSTPTV